MGIDFIRDKKERFEQQADACLNRELDVDLITGAYKDQEWQLIRCELLENVTMVSPIGLRLILRIHDESDITVLESGKVIAKVSQEDARRLVDLVKANQNYTGFITVVATETPNFLGEFHVRPHTPFKENC